MNATYRMKHWLRQMVRITPLYRKTMKSISFDPREEEAVKELKKIVAYAIKSCPYYKDYKPVDENFDIKNYPIIHKSDLLAHGEEMISTAINRKMITMVSTGGTTGPSVNVASSYREEIITTAYNNYLFERFGKGTICTIREHDLKPGEKYRSFGNRLMLSPNSINQESVSYYVDLMKQKGVRFLHVYPTSILSLCKYIQHSGIDTSDLPIKAIVASSEIFAIETKQLIKEVFPTATIVDYYGQTEHVAAGVALDFEPMRFFTSYGYVELIDSGVRERGDVVAEIVSTSLFKTSQPLIRYATGDFVVIDSEGNIRSLLGRTSDFLIGKEGNLIPAVITNRPETMANVLLIQYYQDTPGLFDYNITVNEHFTDADKKMIEEDIYDNFGDTLLGTVKVVDHIEQTARGKHKKLIQKLDVQSYIDAL